MHHNTSVDRSLADDIINRVEALTLESDQAGKPLEVEPYRKQLFELFVTADGAEYVEDDSEFDLTADGLCRALAARWNLAQAARESFQQQEQLTSGQLSRMRLLWSVMRMWMEWTYAWRRWDEFHHGKPVKSDERRERED